jgi:MFS family permease
MGMNAAQQLRVAAADMYPPTRRAEGLGYVLTGSLVGVLVTPALVMLAQLAAPGLGVDPLGLPWLLLPLLIVPGMVFVLLIRPDPKEIAQRLADYYPGYTPPRREPGQAAEFRLATFFQHESRRLAVLLNLGSQSCMAVVMVSSSLLLHEHGSSLAQIAASSALHSFGMWAFALPLGRLADRLGRRAVLLGGGVTATLGAVVATQTEEYLTITAGAFLVGVGWCAANVAATVVIADTTDASARGRGVGFNDSLGAAANILVPLIAGPMGAVFGVPSTGLLAAALMALSPFAIFYSDEARAYATMMLLVTISTLALLRALDGPRRAWWAVFAVSSCAALWSHYTAVFAIAAQTAWAAWTHRDRVRELAISGAAIVVGYLPWLPGFVEQHRNHTAIEFIDLTSPVNVGRAFELPLRTLVGHPFLLLPDAPGNKGFALIAAVAALAAVAAARRTSALDAAAALRPSAAWLRSERTLVAILALATTASSSREGRT